MSSLKVPSLVSSISPYTDDTDSESESGEIVAGAEAFYRKLVPDAQKNSNSNQVKSKKKATVSDKSKPQPLKLSQISLVSGSPSPKTSSSKKSRGNSRNRRNGKKSPSNVSLSLSPSSSLGQSGSRWSKSMMSVVKVTPVRLSDSGDALPPPPSPSTVSNLQESHEKWMRIEMERKAKDEMGKEKIWEERGR